jgi:hypothetical protein
MLSSAIQMNNLVLENAGGRPPPVIPREQPYGCRMTCGTPPDLLVF